MSPPVTASSACVNFAIFVASEEEILEAEEELPAAAIAALKVLFLLRNDIWTKVCNRRQVNWTRGLDQEYEQRLLH